MNEVTRVSKRGDVTTHKPKKILINHVIQLFFLNLVILKSSGIGNPGRAF